MTKPSAQVSVPHPASAGSVASGSESGPTLHRTGGGLGLAVRVTPSAPQTLVRGIYGDRLKISVAAPPEDDRANQELIKALAKWLDMPRNSVGLESGRKSRDKVVVFTGVDEPELRRRLNELVGLDEGRKQTRG